MSPRFIRIGAASLALSLAGLAAAAEHATPREARALFDQAVKYLQVNGPDQAWKAFNKRSGPFVKKDLYVYVIDRKGTYVANGAAPAQLVGLNVLPPRQNSCHLDRILNSGAMMRERVGAIRTRIQRQSGGAVAAAGECCQATP